MISLILLIAVPMLLLVLLDVAALCWGTDSTERVDSPEWERRQRWHGYGGTD